MDEPAVSSFYTYNMGVCAYICNISGPWVLLVCVWSTFAPLESPVISLRLWF